MMCSLERRIPENHFLTQTTKLHIFWWDADKNHFIYNGRERSTMTHLYKKAELHACTDKDSNF